MNRLAMDIDLNVKQCPQWVQANDKASGYYRVAYEDALLERLTGEGGREGLSAPESVDLIGNARALVESGNLPAETALGLVARFHGDPERHVLQAALDLGNSFQKYLVPEDLRPQYARFIKDNFGERAHELGWRPTAGEPDDTRLLRPPLVLSVSTYGNDEALSNEARTMTERWLESHKGIDPSVMREVFSSAAYHGNEDLAKRFISEWTRSDAQEQLALLWAMFNFRDERALRALFQAVLSGELPATPASYIYFHAGADSTNTVKERFHFLAAHFDEVLSKLPNDPFGPAAHLPTVGEGFCDERMKTEFQEFFNPRAEKLIGGSRILTQTIEGIDKCIAVKTRQQSGVAHYLRK
jgi:alanyl aminopeptidase